MLSGLIIYSRIDKDKNAWFINRCIENLTKKGISLIYKDEDDVLAYLEDNKIDFVIYRARDYRLLEELEARGIRCFNNALTNKTANNKYLSYLFFVKNNITCIPSFLSFEEVGSLPTIMKSVDGHGGSEVFLLEAKEDAIAHQMPNKTYIYQPFYQNDGDLRLYVLNKKVVGAVLRKGNADFRSNFSLGGDVEIYQPEEELIKTAELIATLLNADYIGVDFLKVNNKWLANEIEDPVGARMLYKALGIDASILLCDYIFDSLNQ